MENIFKTGEVVYARINLTEKLVIRRYVDRIYYCRVQRDNTLPEQVYFERELVSDSSNVTTPK